MVYREIETAPENEEVSAVWGEKRAKPEYGTALRLGDQWFIHGEQNPYANGKPCATPDGWLPMDQSKWTKAERKLCDILAMHPDLK
jgi:hypothetical protein